MCSLILSLRSVTDLRSLEWEVSNTWMRFFIYFFNTLSFSELCTELWVNTACGWLLSVWLLICRCDVLRGIIRGWLLLCWGFKKERKNSSWDDRTGSQGEDNNRWIIPCDCYRNSPNLFCIWDRKVARVVWESFIFSLNPFLKNFQEY